MSNTFTFRQLMSGRLAASITCAMTGDVVRRLAVIGDRIDIVCRNGEAVGVALDAEVRYEEWFMDRGSLLFTCTDVASGYGKLCTEGDLIRYDDGVEASVDKWGVNVQDGEWGVSIKTMHDSAVAWAKGQETASKKEEWSQVATGPIDDNLPF